MENEYCEALVKDTTPAGLNCIKRASDIVGGFDWWNTQDYKHFFSKADETFKEMENNNNLPLAETDHNEFIARETVDLMVKQKIQLKYDTGIIEIMGEAAKEYKIEKEAIILELEAKVQELEDKLKQSEEALATYNVNGPFKIGNYYCKRTGRPISIIKKNPATQVVKFGKGFGVNAPTYRKMKVEDGKAFVNGNSLEISDRFYWQDLELVEG